MEIDENNLNTTNINQTETEDIGTSFRTMRSGSTISMPEEILKNKLTKKRKKSNENNSGEESNLDDIIRTRTVLEEFLFNENNKISKAAIKFILSKWSRLEQKLNEEIIEKERWKAIFQGSRTKGTYADIAKSSLKQPSERIGIEKRSVSNRHEVIIIKPEKEETDERTNEDIKTQVLEELKDVKNKLKIRRVRQLRKKGILMEVDSMQDIEIIKKASLETKCLKAEEPRKILPSLIIYEVEKEYKAEDIKNDLIEKNFEMFDKKELESIKEKVTLKHSFKTKSNNVNWIVQLPGIYLERLIDRGRIYLQWRTYRIKEYLNITRCFKCHGFGHISKVCRNPEQLCETCGDKNHVKKDCKKKDFQCINCTRNRRKELNHSVRSIECPEYKKQVEIYLNKVRWV